jgi:hypothetical protein
LIELNRGLARLDLPDFELASRNDVDALGAFLEANGMTVVDPPGEYYGRSYYAVYFTDPDGMKLEAMGVQAAAEEAPGGKEVSRRRFTAHSFELHSPLLITSRKQWNGADDRFPQPQVASSTRRRSAKRPLASFAQNVPRPHAEEHRSTSQAQMLRQRTRAAMRLEA